MSLKLQRLRQFCASTAAAVAAALVGISVNAAAPSWPMFRGNPGLTGLSEANLPNKLKLGWTFKTSGPVKSSPAIVDGKVFVGSNDGHLYALNLDSGQKVWAFKTEGEVESSPLVLDGVVYVGSTDGSLYAVNVADGKQLWQYATGDKILGSPNYVKTGNDTRVIVGGYDYKLHCLDAKTGKTNWVYETGNYINGSPAVFNGKTV